MRKDPDPILRMRYLSFFMGFLLLTGIVPNGAKAGDALSLSDVRAIYAGDTPTDSAQGQTGKKYPQKLPIPLKAKPVKNIPRNYRFRLGLNRYEGPAPAGLFTQSRIMVLPSLFFEGFPMVIREAFALGVPVASSRIGALPEIVKDGVAGTLFEPGSAEDLLLKVRDLWADQGRLEKMSTAARYEFEDKYTADANYQILMKIYGAAIQRRRKRQIQNR